MAAHIFIDNSNMIGGAQRAARALEPHAPWQSIRLYNCNFFWLLEHTHEVQTRVLGGSVPPRNEALWEYARDAGYDTSLLRRIARDDGRLAEQAVDEVLHLRIANALLDYDPPQLLVIAMGDGNQGEFGTSFDEQVSRMMLLDPHYFSITYVRGSEYAVNGVLTRIADRVVAAPNW